MTFLAAAWAAIRTAWTAVKASPALMWSGIVAVAGVVLQVLLWRARRQGAHEARQEDRIDALEDQNDRLAKGREAVRDGRRNDDLADRLRQNDGRWN